MYRVTSNLVHCGSALDPVVDKRGVDVFSTGLFIAAFNSHIRVRVLIGKPLILVSFRVLL